MNTKWIGFIKDLYRLQQQNHSYFPITASPELSRVSVDLSSHTEQFLDDIVLQNGILTCPSPSPSSSSISLFPPHDQRLIELLMPLCPANWMKVLPKRAIKGKGVELGVKVRERKKL